ncbi:MAG: nickel-dependent lactate racemase [Chloroflexi bacterium]|nr:nickel-dependent lactate racemase [Chloroflexota bacterium]
MQFQIPYGKTHLEFSLSDSLRAELIAPAAIPPLTDAPRAVSDALDAPLAFDWSRFARAQSVAIAINDKTRPVPLAILLPPLLQKLARLDVPREAITLLIATGTHAPMRADEFGAVVPADILAHYRVISHDCDDGANLIELGATTRGTRVLANRVFVEAELRIAIGDIEPHQFMGFSGGVKAAAIGVAGRATITHNHSLMLDPHAYQGRYADNPARQDVEEIGKMMGVHCALNPVVNAEKKIVGVFAGDPVAVIHAGMPLALDVYRVKVTAPFDLMIVSAGGHPKDINVYQAQKALGHAMPVMNLGGTIIWVAACPEGSGSKLYEEYLRDVSSQHQVLERFQREPFRLGYHKAFQIARDATRARVLMVTDMPRDLTTRLLLDKCDSLDAALTLALRDLPRDARIGVMPAGNVTIPSILDL